MVGSQDEVKGSQKKDCVEAAKGFCGSGEGEKCVSTYAQLHIDGGLTADQQWPCCVLPRCPLLAHTSTVAYRVKLVTSLSYCCLSGWSGSAAVTHSQSFFQWCAGLLNALWIVAGCWMLKVLRYAEFPWFLSTAYFSNKSQKHQSKIYHLFLNLLSVIFAFTSILQIQIVSLCSSGKRLDSSLTFSSSLLTTFLLFWQKNSELWFFFDWSGS